jgi:hypothetical protein
LLAALLLLAPALARAQSATDNFTFTPGVSKTNIDGGVVDDTSSAITDENKSGHARMTPLGALHFNLRNQAGTEIGTNANPVQVGDGGGSLTIDGTVAISGTVTVSDGAGALTVDGTVSIGAALPAGTNNIGDVDVLTLPSVTVGTFPDNEPFNVAQINGATPLAGNGVTGTGSLRVTIASDNTAFTVNAAQSGTWNVNNISGTVSLPTGAATSANQLTEITSLQLLDDVVEVDDSGFVVGVGSIIVAGCLEATDTMDVGDVGGVKCGADRELDVDLAGAIPAGTNNIGDVDVLTLPSVTIGTFPDNEPFNIAQINGVTPLMGNGVTGTGSLRVTIASDNTAFAVNAAQSGTWNINNVSGTVSLPTGAATSANQATEIASLQALDNIPQTEDTASASGDSGVTVFAQRASAPANTSSANGDYEPLQVNGGRLWVSATVDAALPAGANNIGDVDVLTLPALPAGTNEIGRVRLTDGTDLATVLNLAGEDPLAVAIVDGAGAQITSFGGGTQYTEGDTDTTITGTAMLWEDTANTLRPVASGTPLPVNVVAGGAGDGKILDGTASGQADVLDYTNSRPLAVRLTDTNGDYVGAGAGTQYTVNAVAPADPVGTAGLMERDDALSALSEIEGDWTNQRSNANGALWVAGDGTFVVGDGSGALTVDGTINAAQSGTWNITNVSGTISLPTGAATSANQSTEITALQLIDNIVSAEDTASANLDGGAVVLAKRTDTAPAATSGLNGDYEPLQVNGGRLWVSALVDTALPAGTNNIGDVDVATLPAVTVGTFPDNEPFNVAQINGVAPLVGNGVTGTGSLRVTIASDNTAFTVNAAQSGTWNISNISGTISLPTGAATSANQSTLITSSQLIDDLVTTEDQASANLDEGTVLLALRKALPANTSDADLDYEALQMLNGRLYTSSTIDAAIPAGTNNIGDVDVATLPSVTVGTFPDNEPFNLAQIAGIAPLTGNGVTGTGSLRVTVASDNTAFSVNALQSGAWSNRITDGTDTAQVFDLAANDPLSVAIVDGSGTQITSFGGGVEYTEDVAAAADPVGKAVNLVRADTPATITSTNGDNIAQRGTNYGAAYVQLVTSAGAFIDSVGGGTEFNEDAAHTTGALGKLNLAVRNDAGTAFTSADGDYSPMRVDSAGNVATFLTDGSEIATIRDTGTSDSVNVAIVDGSGNQITSFGGGSQFAVDAVAGATDLGTLALVVRDDALATLTPIDGDYTQLRVTSQGRLYTSTTIDAALPAGTNNIGDVDILTFPDNEPFNLAQVGGSTLASHDAAVAGAPVIVGAAAETPEDTTPSNRVSADADAVRIAATRDGQQYVAPFGPQIWESSAEYTTAQTDTSLKAAPGAGLSFYITDITVVCNAAVTVSLEEDDTTDDLIDRMYCSGLGGGHERHLITPHKTTANQALLLTTSAAVTVFVAVSGYTAP